MDELKKNSVTRCRVEGYTSQGDGVVRLGGRAVFVPGAIRGEVCDVRVLKAGQNACYGRVEALYEPSPERQTPECPFYAQCGGCRLMHMTYAEELRMKRQRVEDALRRIGGIDVPVEEILGAERTAGYRNKAIFAVGQRGGRPVIGFYRERSREVTPVRACLIQPEVTNRAAAALRGWMERYGVAGWEPERGTGVVRQLFCRWGERTGEAQVAVVTRGAALPHGGELVRMLREACPELVSIVQNVNASEGNTVFGGTFRTLWGRDWLEDELCGLRFRLSAPSFYQVNRRQAERLYAAALEMAALTPADTALDLCCGTGTITLLLAGQAGRAVGVELVPEAVADARENAARNGVSNALFLCADAAKLAPLLAQREIVPTVAVVDPPRKGLPSQAVEAIGALRPRRVVYVSCDPATLARDARLLTALGYAARRVIPVDLFPRTAHVETVVQFVLRNPVTHTDIEANAE